MSNGTGLTRAIVTQNEDPEGLGRVQVRYPSMASDTNGDWACIVVPFVEKRAGAITLPDVGDEVVVGFEQGDMRLPLVLGAVYDNMDRPADVEAGAVREP